MTAFYGSPVNDMISNQWKKDTWSKTVRKAARRGAAESLLKDRLQQGANKWRTGLFDLPLSSPEPKRHRHLREKNSFNRATCTPKVPKLVD
jgi:hypothetical protein